MKRKANNIKYHPTSKLGAGSIVKNHRKRAKGINGIVGGVEDPVPGGAELHVL
jgi:hypothetical protein